MLQFDNQSDRIQVQTERLRVIQNRRLQKKIYFFRYPTTVATTQKLIRLHSAKKRTSWLSDKKKLLRGQNLRVNPGKGRVITNRCNVGTG